MPEIINKQVVGLGFGFLQDEEIRKLSVKQITNAFSFDNLRQPVRGGLYDRSFGPIEPFDVCVTCDQAEKDCPGHCGHINLAVPIYNVFLFEQVFKLLNLKCWNCHKLRANEIRKKALLAQLYYLRTGSLEKAQEVEELLATGIPVGSKGSREESELKSSALFQKILDHVHVARKLSEDQFVHTLPIHVHSFRAKILRQFYTWARVNKCQHCSAMSPTFRRDGHTKIFVNALSVLAEKHNVSIGACVDNLMNFDVEIPTDNKKSKSKKNNKQQKPKNDSDSEEESDIEQDMDIESEPESDPESPVTTTTSRKKKDTIVQDVVVNTSRLMLPNEVERHMSVLWENDGDLLSQMFAPQTHNFVASSPFKSSDYHIFFHRVLLLPPSRFRPPRMLNGEMFENGQNVSYRKIFEANDEILKAILESNGNKKVSEDTNLEALSANARLRVVTNWLTIQQETNLLFDSEKTGSQLAKSSGMGIKQLLEKKQGLFRKNMMGKRVNFAARSVISPDPFLHTKEIGIPDIFAKTLTYPQPVTPYNVEELRQAVINGAHVQPGANAVIDERGNVTSLERLSREQRVAIAKTLLSDTATEDAGRHSSAAQVVQGSSVCSVEKNLNSRLAGDPGPKVVLRHLKTGDVLLVNRQPTLHKPSMMTHVARVLFGQSTIRMHYANCNSYNADFDGDEINLHFPQSELARAEAYDISNTDNQYIVPTSGNPLRGLIQDHVVCGVRLTQRNTFLNQEYFQQFLYLAVADNDMPKHALRTPIPAILKPYPLWTGKQLLSTVLSFVTFGKPKLNLNPVKTKVPANAWGSKQGEEDGSVIIRGNELVQGVLDKAQFGASKFGLVHAVYELYGATAAGNLLTVLSRLFTRVLQYDGFTCGLEDMLLLPEADKRRLDLIDESTFLGISAAAECAGLKNATRDELLYSDAPNVAIQQFFHDTSNAGERLDGAVKGSLNQCTSSIISACLPSGQRVPFPHNNMAMMTLSGAKGSMVNFSQISCLLGQQELEGRRVPVTVAGKTLPSFPKYDPQPRAGGYVTQRFFTGIRPQEYYFHCMAGREGLVDTAVKTARSGYLQRCVIKHLECLNVQYDYTVRDVDGSVVQFQYGEDSIDVLKASYLRNMTFLADNYAAAVAKLRPEQAVASIDCTSAEEYNDTLKEYVVELKQLEEENARKMLEEDEKLLKCEVKASDATDEVAKKLKDRTKIENKRQKRFEKIQQAKKNIDHALPVSAQFPLGSTLGAVAPAHSDVIEQYCKSDPDNIFEFAQLANDRAEKMLKSVEKSYKQTLAQVKALELTDRTDATQQEKLLSLKAKAKAEEHRFNDLRDAIDNSVSTDKFTHLMNLNYLWSLVNPGENVGVLAGQSIGEPSTQMTLNTFHLAGHGGANVTLGIPRLREIIMTASETIATPIMEIPLAPGYPASAIKTLAAKLNKVKLSECVKSVDVRQRPGVEFGSREYIIRLNLKDLNSQWAKDNLLDMKQIIRCISTQFAFRLNGLVKQKLKTSDNPLVGAMKTSARIVENDEENEETDNVLNALERRKLREAEEGVKDSARFHKGKESSSYDDEEEEKDDNDTNDMNEATPETEVPETEEMKDEEETDDMSNNGSAKSIDNTKVDISVLIKTFKPLWSRYELIKNVVFDERNYEYVEIYVLVPPNRPKVLMLSLTEKVLDNCLVRSTKGIQSATVIERTVKGVREQIVQTNGVNFSAVWKHQEADSSRIKCNDIAALLKVYGVEAARAAIKDEISGVFGVYGIAVDPRHLLLVADYMTFQGGYMAMNRSGMELRSASMQKITFETSLKFILDSALRGDVDDLNSPSSCLVVGRPMRTGTGAFSLLQPLSI